MIVYMCVVVFIGMYRSLYPFQPTEHYDVRVLFPASQLFWRFEIGGQSHGLLQGSGIPAHIVVGWFIFHGSLYAIGQEAEDGPNPQKDGEAPKKLATELDPLRCCRRWSEGIGPIPSQDVLGPLVGEALQEARGSAGVCIQNQSSPLPFLTNTLEENNIQVERKIPCGWKG